MRSRQSEPDAACLGGEQAHEHVASVAAVHEVGPLLIGGLAMVLENGVRWHVPEPWQHDQQPLDHVQHLRRLRGHQDPLLQIEDDMVDQLQRHPQFGIHL